MRLKTFFIRLSISLLICTAYLFGLALQPGTAFASETENVSPGQQAKLASIQVPFVPNQGQVTNNEVKFYAQTFAGTVFITDNGITYALPQEKDGSGWAVKEEFAGAKVLAPAAVGSQAAPVNYYFGKQQKSLPSYNEITLGEVYDHINVNLKAYGNNVEKIFTVNPGGDPGIIKLQVTGTDKLSVDAQGELELTTGLGTVKMTSPVAYQIINGQRINVDVAYEVKGDTYSFKVGTYNQDYSLVIDPLLASTYLGGSGSDQIKAMAIDTTDTAGNIFVTGYTTSTNFPMVTGWTTEKYPGWSNTYAGGSGPDVFVAKLSGDLKYLRAATYLGGTNADMANAITLDNSGYVYITGTTKSGSNTFPVIGGSNYQDPYGNTDIFVAKLDCTNLYIAASTCYGGNGVDTANAIAFDPTSGDVFVAGQTASTDLTVTGHQTNRNKTSGITGLVIKFKSDLSVQASTFIGGTINYDGSNYSNDYIYAIAVDKKTGNVYVGGGTTSSDYPTTTNAFKTTFGNVSTSPGIISELSNDLSQLNASTYLGGSLNSATNVRAITFDPTGNVCVTGDTQDTNFPVNNDAYQKSFTVNSQQTTTDGFVTKLKSDLSGPLQASTFIGGTGNETPYAIASDTNGNLYIAGNTNSNPFPTTTGAYQQLLNGTGTGTNNDAFVTKLNSTLTSQLLDSTYFGGTGSETAYALGVNGSNVYIAGNTTSTGTTTGLPVTQYAYQGTNAGSNDGFIAELSAPTYAVSGIIKDTTGAAIQLATVDAGGGNKTTTGADGSYTLNLANGTYTLNVSETGYQSETINITVNGAALSDQNLTLTTSAAITYAVSGIITDTTGAAIQLATVDAGGDNKTTTRTNGSYTLNLANGTYTLNVSKTGYQSGTINITVNGAGLQGQNLTLTTSAAITYAVSGIITDTTGAAIQLATVDAGSGNKTITRTDGYYILNLANGTYSLNVSKTGYQSGTISITVNGAALLGQNLTLTTSAAISYDTQPPNWPNGYSVSWTPTTYTSAKVTWNAAADDVAVTDYKIYLCTPGAPDKDILVDPATLTLINNTYSYNVTGMDSQTPYAFKVDAGDKANNWTHSAEPEGPQSITSIVGTGPGLTGAYLSGFTYNTDDKLYDISSTGGLVSGNNNMLLNPTIKLCFTHSVVDDTDAAGDPVFATNQKNITLETASGTIIPITVSRITTNFNERQNLFVTPKSPLSSGTAYKIILSRDLIAKNGSIACIQQEVDFSTPWEINTPTVTVASDGSNKNLSITTNTPSGAAVTIPSSVNNATINVAAMLNTPTSGTVTTNALPALSIAANTSLSAYPVLVNIPAGTAVSVDSSWDGTINVPTVIPANNVAVKADSGQSATVSAAVEVGFGEQPLTLSKAVRILIPGQAGKNVGYTRGVTFTKITNALSQDSGDSLAPGGDGYINVGNDLVIWTKHFTEFVAYTETASTGSGDTQSPQWPANASLVVSSNFTSATLSWSAATDDVGVVGYEVECNGQVVATLGGTKLTYVASNFPSGAIWSVQAEDNAGNLSTALSAAGEAPGGGSGGGAALSFDPSKSYLVTVSGSSASTIASIQNNTNVPISPTIMLYFDHGVTTSGVWNTNQSCITMKDSSGTNVPLNSFYLTQDAGSDYVHDIFLTPVSNLTASKTYTITISGNLTANNGATLVTDQTVAFTVAGSGSSGNSGAPGNSGSPGSVADIQPPSFPLGATVSVDMSGDQQASLTWPEATDNVGVTGYNIYRYPTSNQAGTKLLGKSTSTSWSDPNSLPSGTTAQDYTWKVQAYDAAGNLSEAISGIAQTKNSPLDFYPNDSYIVNVSGRSIGDTATQIGSVDGNTDVPVNPIFMLHFDRGVTNDTVWSTNQSCITLQDSTGANVPITLFRLDNLPGTAHVRDIFFAPTSKLTTGKTYKIIISKNLTANNSHKLGETSGNQDVTVTFTVGNSTLPTGGQSTQVPASTSTTPAPGGDNTAYNQAALAALAKATPDQIQKAKLPADAPTVDPAATSPVKLTANDGIQLIVPPTALGNQTGPVQMTVALGTIATAPAAEKTAIVLDPLKYERQFGIQGQTEGSVQFTAPVTITFPVAAADLPKGTTVQQLAIYWWNPAKSDWVKLGGVYNAASGTISVPTYHFSTYAVMVDTSSTPNRLSGSDRFATANAVAEQGWKAGADTVVLANAYSYPDALAAGTLAYKLNAPILLTDTDSLAPSTLDEIKKLAPKKFILVGGTGVISQAIQDSLTATYGKDNVVRYGGTDRYATAAAIAAALGTTGHAVIVNGDDGHYADTLAVSSYAAYNGIPILFTTAEALPEATVQALREEKVKDTIVVGGEGVVSAPVYNQLPGTVRYSGATRYETATSLAIGLHLNLSKVYMVTGLDFADALVAGNLAAHTQSPLVMVDKEMPTPTADFFLKNKAAISNIISVGGEGAITPVQDNAVRQTIVNK